MTFIIRVTGGPMSKDEFRRGVSDITIGSGPKDDVRVFGDDVVEAHIRIFPIANDLNPAEEILGWQFAYPPNVLLKNSEGDARFGTITEGTKFHLGENELTVVRFDEKRSALDLGTIQKPSPLVTGVIFAIVLAAAGAYIWQGQRGTRSETPAFFFLSYADALKGDRIPVIEQIVECRRAVIQVPPETLVTQQSALAYSVFLDWREVLPDTPEESALYAQLMNSVRPIFKRAVLFFASDDFSSAAEELSEVAEFFPVPPTVCTIKRQLLQDISNLKG